MRRRSLVVANTVVFGCGGALVGTAADLTGGSARPVNRITMSMPSAIATINHVCMPRGSTPRGTGRRSVTGATSDLATTSLMVNALAES
jgi:hypothetical protein